MYSTSVVSYDELHVYFVVLLAMPNNCQILHYAYIIQVLISPSRPRRGSFAFRTAFDFQSFNNAEYYIDRLRISVVLRVRRQLECFTDNIGSTCSSWNELFVALLKILASLTRFQLSPRSMTYCYCI